MFSIVSSSFFPTTPRKGPFFNQRQADFDYEINHVMGGIECTDGSRKRAKIVLLAGADLLETMSSPGLWDERDLDHILGNFGVFVLERTGTELDSALQSLKQWGKNIHVIRQVNNPLTL